MSATHCPYCALQCAMTVSVDGPQINVAAREFPTNRGGMCQKGATAGTLLRSPHRLTTPLARAGRDGRLEPVGWDEALNRVAAGLAKAQREHGPDAAAVFGGGGLTNEKAYALGKFARVALRTSAIDYNGRFCMSAAAAATTHAFGLDRGLPFPLSDLADADTILLVGSNPAETMPPFTRWLAEQRGNGGALIVVDPRRTPTARRATLHLQPTPGTDLALANGLLHIVIAGGYVDEQYIAARTTGFDAVRRAVAGYWPERVERITGVAVADQHAAARLLVAARSAMVLSARGAEQHRTGADTVTALINLALALGLPGRPASGYGTLTGQGNGQGGREHGQKADQLPGYRRLDDTADREHVAAAWGIPASRLPVPGRSAYELLDSLGTADGARALLIMGSNVVVSAPANRRIADRLAALDFLAVCDVVLSETAALADVVLPVTQWAEETGTITNLEGRVLLRAQAIEPPEGVRSDLDVIRDLAARLGAPGRWDADARAVFDELRAVSAGGAADYAGITHERIVAEDGIFWPCPTVDHPGTPRLFAEAFATADGRARFAAVEHRGTAEQIDADYPVYLTTGRLAQHYQSGAQTRRVPELLAAQPQPLLEIHPQLAALHGLDEGETVRVISRRGQLEAQTRITETVRRDTVFLPFHWGGAQSVNQLTNPALDPVSKMPEFKVCAVRLEKPHNVLSPPPATPPLAGVPPVTLDNSPARAGGPPAGTPKACQ